MATDIATQDEPRSIAPALAQWSRQEIDVIRELICPGATDAELALFGKVCQRTGLDPFARQIYGIMRAQNQKQPDGSWNTTVKLSIQTSIDGFRLIAERTEKYGGQIGPQWCGPDGEWRDVWLADDYPAAARVGVIRTDWQQPLYAVATWKSYVQTFKNKQGQQVVGNMWQSMPDVMLAKVAEALALRRAFPQELSGLYTNDEMAQADRREPVQPAPTPDPTPILAAFKYPEVGDRWKAVAEYERLAALAVERRHKAAAKIKSKRANDLTDGELEAAVQSLTRWEASLKASVAVDAENAGEYES